MATDILSTQAPTPRSRILRLPRALWLALGAASMAGAIAAGGPLMIALWLAPDLAILVGLPRPFDAQGRMNSRAVAGYNAAHYLYGPSAMLIGAIVIAPLLPLGLVWLCHVAVDRGLGYYPRASDGSIRDV